MTARKTSTTCSNGIEAGAGVLSSRDVGAHADAEPMRIGFAWSGSEVWIAALLRAIKRNGTAANVVAIACDDKRYAEVVGARHGIDRAYSSALGMTREERLDAVVFAPPAYRRGDGILVPVSAGGQDERCKTLASQARQVDELMQVIAEEAHVLFVSPLPLTGEEARRAGLAARAQRRVLRVGYDHQPSWAWGARRIELGDLGPVERINATWRRSPGLAGRAFWYELMALLTSIISMLDGDLEDLDAKVCRDTLQATLRFAGDVRVDIEIGRCGTDKLPVMLVQGLRGTALVSLDLTAAGSSAYRSVLLRPDHPAGMEVDRVSPQSRRVRRERIAREWLLATQRSVGATSPIDPALRAAEVAELIVGYAGIA